MDGLLLLDKTAGLTSNGVLQRVKHLFRAAKAGHTGSLDPLATGVLPICFGEATKFARFLLDADKRYQSKIILGVGTDTGDSDGAVTHKASAAHVDEQAVAAAVKALTGEIKQVPPMYSAIKIGGQRLYKLARAGEQLNLTPRTVLIHNFRVIDFSRGNRTEIIADIWCSKGTYIRSLARDLGDALGVPAHVSELRRTQSGRFGLDGAVTIPELERTLNIGSLGSLDNHLLPLEYILGHLPRLELSKAATFYIREGRAVLVPNAPRSGMVRIADADGSFLGVGVMKNDGLVAPKRLLASGVEREAT